MSFLQTSLIYLKGVGFQKAELLKKELNIYTYKDLLEYFPFRYLDKSKIYTINKINSDNEYVQLKGKITSHYEVGEFRNRRLIAEFTDGTGYIELIWFKGINWIYKTLILNQEVIVFGKLSQFISKYQIIHPEMEINANNNLAIKIEPLYNTTEKLKQFGLGAKSIGKIILQVLNLMPKNTIIENLPINILNKENFISRQDAFYKIHFPNEKSEYLEAIRRLKFEEFFIAQARLAKLRTGRYKYSKGLKFENLGKYFNEFYNKCLPFELTNAQKRVLKEIRKDTLGGFQMNRLLQGDVGSGKTIVAIIICLIALDNDFQACIMAPTEILANQHFISIKNLTEKLNINVELLTSSVKRKAKNEILQNLKDNKINILIGTHSVIEKNVEFAKLGLAVIDEQHKFGVAQRGALWVKNNTPPHILVMTATPIPRTLAMTAYGDLDYSVIDELPPGRKQIQTIHKYDRDRPLLIDFIKQQIEQGRQIYVVFPLIEESETMSYQNLLKGIEIYQTYFREPKYYISVVYGKQNADLKKTNMQRFVKNETQIMLSTTVIEVGVNVPNASVMIIESAEKYGLSQLHQLRGRVGRGGEKSFCILMTDTKLTKEAKERINIMCKTNNGFEIAEKDLEIRGPGEIDGTKQSGSLIFKLANIVDDREILLKAKNEVEIIFNEDIDLNLEKHKPLKDFLILEDTKNTIWKKIS